MEVAIAQPAANTSTFITNTVQPRKRTKKQQQQQDQDQVASSAVDMNEEDANATSSNSAANAGNKPKRKKVSKACIFCKRSHMTCTENRPCDRCIKRDIAHLCTDVEPSKRTSIGSSAEKPQLSTPTSNHLQLSPSHPSTSLPFAQQQQNQQQNQSLQSPEGISSSAIVEDASTNQGKPNASPIFNTSAIDLSMDAGNPQDQQPPPILHHRASSTTLAGPTQSPAYANPQLPQAHNDITPSGLNGSQALTTTSPNNNNLTPQHTSQQQKMDQQTFNPFALLSQAYDYSYPSHTSSSNSLASLRLFATTADAQFGNFSHASTFPLNQSSLGLMGNQHGASSDAGTNSDVDSNALDDFLKTLDEMYLNPMPDVPQSLPSHPSATPLVHSQQLSNASAQNSSLSTTNTSSNPHIDLPSNFNDSNAPFSLIPSAPSSPPGNTPILGPTAHNSGGATPSSSTERFLLTAADQKEDGTRDERLNKVIRAKYEAGLLKPFNYIKGYERLNSWVEKKWGLNSKLRTLKILSEFRPAFRAIASSLTDLDLIFIEEAFERLLLDYDRVFSTMGIPACLWRRTGEIFKGNREFAELVGIPYNQLREGKLAIYELMAEDSAVNFWEKYGSIAFDPGQKAVLTSCVLVNQAILKRIRNRSSSNSSDNNSAPSNPTLDTGNQNGQGSYSVNSIPKEALVNCTFSFTIRRDAYHIPNAIVGNFMAYTPKP